MRTRRPAVRAFIVALTSVAVARGLPDLEVREAVHPLPLADVRLLGGPLKHAQDLDGAILLDLDPARMLAPYRRAAGLDPCAPGYGGWEGGGRNLTGHLGGHALSGLSLMYAATGDVRFRSRVDRLVTGLAEVQRAQGDGYLGALAGGRRCFGDLSRGIIRSSGFDLNGLWSPWYTLHKTFAGLRDAYRYAGNSAALAVETRFAAWAEGVLADLNDVQVQRMLHTEFGGMNEVLVDLYADTGAARWLALSERFEHRAVLDPLARHEDILAGRHGNTQIPKLIGAADRFAYTGRVADLLAAAFFWDRVVFHHSYATGGHGRDEYFGPPDHLADRVDGRTCETCNVYNMLRLTRRLFALDPAPRYLDFQERALFNHILASQDPCEGWACYMVPVGRGVRHEYERTMRDGAFTCCTCSSLESHALHGDGLYHVTDDSLWIGLYTPSRAVWQARNVTATVATDLPEGDAATIRLALPAPQAFTLVLRRPYWAGAGFRVVLNGEGIATGPLPPATGPSTLLRLRRTWRDGDTVTLTFAKPLRSEPLPDDPNRVALLWGPLVLAGDLGPETDPGTNGTGSPRPRVPVFVTANRPAAEWLRAVPGERGHFRAAEASRGRDVDFYPFYRLHRRTYGVYWDLFTPAAWTVQAAAYAAEDARRRRLEADTLVYVELGRMQSEREVRFRSGDANPRPVRTEGRPGRDAATWFELTLPTGGPGPRSLVATYCSEEWRRDTRRFVIEVEGRVVAEPVVRRCPPRRFYDETYPLPADLFANRRTVTVTFRARPGSHVAGVYGLRLIRGAGP